MAMMGTQAKPQSPKPKASRRGKSETQFPGKLHDMMSYVEQEGLHSIISWTQNGSGIMIHDPDRLVEILPLFFSQTKYRSFRRQLNMWHFQRVLTGPHRGGFMHPFFIRDRKNLCTFMSRHIDPNDFLPAPLSLELRLQKNSKGETDSSSQDLVIAKDNIRYCGDNSCSILTAEASLGGNPIIDIDEVKLPNVDSVLTCVSADIFEEEESVIQLSPSHAQHDLPLDEVTVSLPNSRAESDLSSADDALGKLLSPFSRDSSPIGLYDSLDNILDTVPLELDTVYGMSNPASPESIQSIFEELSGLGF